MGLIPGGVLAEVGNFSWQVGRRGSLPSRTPQEEEWAEILGVTTGARRKWSVPSVHLRGLLLPPQGEWVLFAQGNKCYIFVKLKPAQNGS